MLGSLFGAAEAHAQVQTFFVNVPAVSEQRDAMELCRDRFTAALVRVGGFRANQDAVTQQSVTDCLGETASATTKRECEVSMANIEVDFLILPTVRRLGEQWNWGIKALSPAQGAAQVWGGDGSSAEADAATAAYAACDGLAKEFACEQGVERACAGSFGSGPVLGGENVVPAVPEGGAGRAPPRQVTVSALDVFEPTPQVVSVWIDGKEAGTSEKQITGIPAGSHSVTLKATGYFDHTENVTFTVGVPSELEGVRLRKTTATLRVQMLEPSVATVFVGGRERGTTAAPLAGIAPGEAEVVLRAEGYRERRERMTLEADGEQTLRAIRLEPLPATLTVTANIMGAEVVVDGAVVGTTSGGADLFEVTPTAKQLELRRSGYTPFVQRLALRPGGSADVSANLSRVPVAAAAPAAASGSSSPATGPAPAAGRSSGAARGCPVGYVRIAPGTFSMGSPPGEEGRDDDESQHSVTITRAYCMKATEVTQGEWQSVMGSNPSYFTDCGANCPVEQVSWEDAVGYANALSRREGLPECYAGSTFAGLACKGYRLPTEAEWEYAARAGTTGSRYGNLDSVAWYDENSGSGTHPVGQKQPNAWGLYDMLGNVREWTGDWYAAYAGSASDPLGAGAGSLRVLRGGSCLYDARFARAAYRSSDAPAYRSGDLGFRLVRTESVASTSVETPTAPSGSFGSAMSEPDPSNGSERSSESLLPGGRVGDSHFGMQLGFGELNGNLEVESGTRRSSFPGPFFAIEMGGLVAPRLIVQGSVSACLGDVNNPVEAGEMFLLVNPRVDTVYYLNDNIWMSAGVGPAHFDVFYYGESDSASGSSRPPSISVGSDWGWGASGSIGYQFGVFGIDVVSTTGEARTDFAELGLALQAFYAGSGVANASSIALLATWRIRIGDELDGDQTALHEGR
jgi:formylglycine-generating enzyme required for sulfatase activity